MSKIDYENVFRHWWDLPATGPAPTQEESERICAQVQRMGNRRKRRLIKSLSVDLYVKIDEKIRKMDQDPPRAGMWEFICQQMDKAVVEKRQQTCDEMEQWISKHVPRVEKWSWWYRLIDNIRYKFKLGIYKVYRQDLPETSEEESRQAVRKITQMSKQQNDHGV